jgi:hypothetical protein
MRIDRRPQQSSRLLYLVVVVQLVLLGAFVNYVRHIGPGVRDVRGLTGSDTSAVTLQEKVTLVHPRPKNYDPPKLVWLMSFPNR